MKLVKDKPVSKACNSCGKVSDKFYKAIKAKDGFSGICKECHREKRRNAEYIRKFGITLDEYNVMFAEQEGKCGICGKHSLEQHLSVDHSHETNEIRGLLCQPCNLGLGKLGDNIEGIESALKYLKGGGYV